MNFAMSYSGGKDGALALYRMIQKGHKPVALITTVNLKEKRSWFHGIEETLLKAVSDSLSIPLLVCACTPEDYTHSFEEGLREARRLGAEACVFGDIDIEGHREWNEARCRNAGIDCILPLWQQDREALVYEMLDAGFRAKIKIIDAHRLDASFLGQDLSQPLLERMKAVGVDICGENGEYHTFVYDGPIFSHPVSFTLGPVIDFGTRQAVEIRG